MKDFNIPLDEVKQTNFQWSSLSSFQNNFPKYALASLVTIYFTPKGPLLMFFCFRDLGGIRGNKADKELLFAFHKGFLKKLTKRCNRPRTVAMEESHSPYSLL